ncbi:MAG: Transcriptional regulator, TetR family protein [Labilithrix sp.]|nr:Transcriptional regulator, TetR family protein [Labilithrix sp.]
MPRPRFAKLEPERQRAILAVAAEEFAEHGYEVASFNRIIERSGLSKGAFYYYFDDKEDLYATVLRDALQRLVLDASPMHAAMDEASFWPAYRAWYVRSLHLFQAEPSAIGLARGLVKALARGAAGGALAELRDLSRGWVEGFLLQGQELGAIRSDLPRDLLVQLVMSLEEGIDLWLGARVGDMSDADIEQAADMLTGVYRDLCAPRVTPPKTRKKKP